MQEESCEVQNRAGKYRIVLVGHLRATAFWNCLSETGSFLLAG